MTKFAVASVVEGHGDVEAVPILLRRIVSEFIGRSDVDVLRPIRVPRSKLTKPAELLRAISLARLKAQHAGADRHLVLVIFDADTDLACELAPSLLTYAEAKRPDVDIAIVLPVAEYETWFIAAAESLGDYLDVTQAEIPADPEAARAKKGWLIDHFRGRYTETVEQPALTAKMDLVKCRARSASFDKLCRELEKRLILSLT
jgi:hypothetical protein